MLKSLMYILHPDVYQRPLEFSSFSINEKKYQQHCALCRSLQTLPPTS